MEAPRWRLTAKHYLNVPGTEYETTETSRETGKQKKQRYHVPLFLDPEVQGDCNYDGEIIVAHEGSIHRRDIIFVGEPTMDMEPLNPEAEALSEKVRARSQHPIDSLPANGDYSQELLRNFTLQFESLVQKLGGIPKGETPNTSMPSDDQMTELMTKMNALMEQNAALERRIAQMEQADAEPLPNEVELTAEEIAASQAAANAAAQAQARRV